MEVTKADDRESTGGNLPADRISTACNQRVLRTVGSLC
jgi:hypothetical protein